MMSGWHHDVADPTAEWGCKLNRTRFTDLAALAIPSSSPSRALIVTSHFQG